MDRGLNHNQRARALRALAERLERKGGADALELARRCRIRASEHEAGPTPDDPLVRRRGLLSDDDYLGGTDD